MKTKDLIIQLFSFLLFLGLQILVARNLVLFGTGFNFIYAAFILLLPFEISTVFLLLLGFSAGLILDIFYDTLGMHAAASLLLGFIRGWWIKIITPRGGYDDSFAPLLNEMGLQWFIIYSFPLLLIHHFALFFIETAGFSMFGYTLLKVIFSTFFSFITIIIVQYLFYPQRRRML